LVGTNIFTAITKNAEQLKIEKYVMAMLFCLSEVGVESGKQNLDEVSAVGLITQHALKMLKKHR